MLRSLLTIAAAIVAMSALSFSGWVFFTPLKATAAAHSSAMSHEKENLDAYLILYDTYRDAGYPPKEAAEVALYVLLRAVGHDVEMPSLDHIDWPEGHEILSPQSSGVALLVEPYLAQEMPDEQNISIVYGMLHEASILTGGAFYLEEEPFDAPQCEARRLRCRFCDKNGEIQTGSFYFSRGMLEKISNACTLLIPGDCPISHGVWLRLKTSEGCETFPTGSPLECRLQPGSVWPMDCNDPDFNSYSCFYGIDPEDIDCEQVESSRRRM